MIADEMKVELNNPSPLRSFQRSLFMVFLVFIFERVRLDHRKGTNDVLAPVYTN